MKALLTARLVRDIRTSMAITNRGVIYFLWSVFVHRNGKIANIWRFFFFPSTNSLCDIMLDGENLN